MAKKTEREVSLWDCYGNRFGEWECSDLTMRASPYLPPPDAKAILGPLTEQFFTPPPPAGNLKI